MRGLVKIHFLAIMFISASLIFLQELKEKCTIIVFYSNFNVYVAWIVFFVVMAILAEFAYFGTIYILSFLIFSISFFFFIETFIVFNKLNSYNDILIENHFFVVKRVWLKEELLIYLENAFEDEVGKNGVLSRIYLNKENKMFIIEKTWNESRSISQIDNYMQELRTLRNNFNKKN